jgi:hypothetical protein
VNLPPGYYGGGINVNSAMIINLSPGLYYFGGSFNVDSSGATVECTSCTPGGAGVTLYFASGNLQANSGGTIKLNAPATGSTSNGDVANMLVWQAAGNSSGMPVDASSTSYLDGIIYLPSAQLTLNSASNVFINSTGSATAVDVQSLMVDASNDFDLTGSLLSGTGTPSSTL